MSRLAALLVLLALLCPLHLCGAAVYYVRPTQPCNAICPGDPCLTLDEYTVSSERYFISNTAFLFLGGNHELSSSFNVSGIHNLTLKPYTDGILVFVHPLIRDPYVPLMMRFKVVSDVTFVELNITSISFVFENSSSISLMGLVISTDPDVLHNFSNPAAVTSTQSNILLTGCKFFTDVTAISCWGNSGITLQGDVVFSGTNISHHNCGMMLHDCGVVISEGNVIFREWEGGAISGVGNSTLVLNATIAFTNIGFHPRRTITMNESSTAVMVGNVSFTNNVTYVGFCLDDTFAGGAIGLHGNSQLVLNGTVTFAGNTTLFTCMGGAILLTGLSTAVLDGDIIFVNNSVVMQGGAITLNENSMVIITGNVSFINNSATFYGGAICVLGISRLVLNGTVTFIGNSANIGGAIASAGDSSVILQGNVTFIGNHAYQHGGAIALLGCRTIWLPETDHTLVTFTNNIADDKGGALYFSQQCSMINGAPPHCAFIFEHLPINPVFNFTDNVAGDGGDAIYGAMFNSTCITPSGIMHTSDYYRSVLNNISLFSPSFRDDFSSVISSDPLQLCFCEDGRPDCSLSPTHSVYPGELFDVSAVVLGDVQGLVNSTVQASVANYLSIELGDLQYIQPFQSRNCVKFTYSIFVNTNLGSDPLFLILEAGSGFDSVHNAIIWISSLHACPVGSSLNRKKKLCDCAPPLLNIETVSCYISGKSIQRQGTVWIGALQQNTNYTRVIYSNTCPFSYCSINKVNITVNQTHLDQDVQCNDNRSGILCGGCRANHSFALGSNRCLPGCTNNRLSLVVVFAAAGIALIFFIKILNLTVSQGTLNGLIFYANIIGAQPTLVLPTKGSSASPAVTTFLSVFIAWLNLDLGIETCFFKNMDAYAKAWLQFAFPIYIWIISLFVILLSKYSMRASRFFGNNSVPVLATLILLSYAKLLRAVISPLSVSHIQFLNGTRIPVWARDGSLQYLTGKHFPLMVLALTVLIVLIISFTFVILSIQWLNRGTHYRVLCWVTKLKPFFDAFTGPFKDNHRYWVGVLLLARCVLLLIFFLDTSKGNSTALVSVTFAAFVILTISGSKYRNNNLALLEQSYILNLGLLVSGTLYVRYASIDGNQEALFNTSVGIAFSQFVATVIFHAFMQVRKPLTEIKSRMRIVLKEDSESTCDSLEEQAPLIQEVHLPQGYSNSHFRESLLSYVDED